ncbi:P-loop containing nucleoside triphosphate hydrolase protein [Xylariales sp. PMI_506]|nr:P-loop containing nucleoside triphosphate hydrolase protein [Xylariales sp. PMI_506]
MESTYQSLASGIVELWESKSMTGQLHLSTTKAEAIETTRNRRVRIALAGPPGSGKTTIAHQVVRILNNLPTHLKASVVSLDGFHLTLAGLRALTNAKEALARRGAPWTLITTSLPTFDHAVKNPVPGGLIIDKDVEVCIIEGNYVLSNGEDGGNSWTPIASLVDERWLVQVDEDLARKRIATRHLLAGIEATMELAVARTDFNDIPNGRYVMEHSQNRYDVLITSIQDQI